MRERVDAFDDPRLDDYRNVPDAVLLAEHGLFCAEGRLVVTRLLDASGFRVRSVMVTRAAAAALTHSLDAHPGVRIFEVTQETMNAVTGFNMHRGCLAIGERPSPLDAAEIVERSRLLVALEGVANADNVGSIFRNAAAFAADAVLLDAACADPLYRKALRTSMGATLQVPYARTPILSETLARARASGSRLVGLTPAADAPPIGEVAARLAGQRIALLLGHEGEGLSGETLERCDVRARIPMAGGVDSLNVATAAAIALYEWHRVR